MSSTLSKLETEYNENLDQAVRQVKMEQTLHNILSELQALREEIADLKANGIVKTTVVQHKASTMQVKPLEEGRPFPCV